MANEIKSRVNEDKNLGITVEDRETEQRVMPLPYIASYGERLSDGSECRVIDCEQGSVAEMMCPKDAEDATAEFIVRAVNSHYALVRLARIIHQDGYLRPVEDMVDIAEEALALVGDRDEPHAFTPHPKDGQFCGECGLLRVDH